MTASASMAQAKAVLIGDDDRIAGGIYVQKREMLSAITHLQHGASVFIASGDGLSELARMAAQGRLAPLPKQQSVVALIELILPRPARLALPRFRFWTQDFRFHEKEH